MPEIYTKQDFLALRPFYDLAFAEIEDKAELKRKDAILKDTASSIGVSATLYKGLKDAYFEQEKNTDKWDPKLRKFHQWSKGVPVQVQDDAVLEQILTDFALMNLNGRIYIYENGVYKMDERGTMLTAIIKEHIYQQFRTAGRLKAVRDLFDKEIRIETKREDLNNHPVTWINVKNGMLDLKTLELHPHSPEYRSINQIPYSFDRDRLSSCTGTDTDTAHFLRSLIPDPENLEMFLEYAGYCMTTDMDQQKFLIVRGEGGTGKSVLLRMVQRLIGSDNCASMTLQNLNDRFSPAFLAGKLLNVYADLSSVAMEQINGVKTITGGDTVRAEYKGGDLFFFKPYCKLLFSANSVPKSLDDKTTAYYRRLLILPIERRAMQMDGLEDRLIAEEEIFFYLCVAAAHRMYLTGKLLVSETSRQEVRQLYRESDTVTAFIEDCLIDERETLGNGFMSRKEVSETYARYCYNEDRTALSRNSLYKDLREKGFEEVTRTGCRGFKYLRPNYTSTDYQEASRRYD